MANTNKNAEFSFGGLGLCLIFCVLLYLKLSGQSDISWWAVWAPFWSPFAILATVLLCIGGIWCLVWLSDHYTRWARDSRKRKHQKHLQSLADGTVQADSEWPYHLVHQRYSYPQVTLSGSKELVYGYTARKMTSADKFNIIQAATPSDAVSIYKLRYRF